MHPQRVELCLYIIISNMYHYIPNLPVKLCKVSNAPFAKSNFSASSSTKIDYTAWQNRHERSFKFINYELIILKIFYFIKHELLLYILSTTPHYNI